MTNGEIEHIEGAATLESQHHDTTNGISDRLKLTLTLRQIILIIIVLSTIGRATSGRWWFDYKQASQVRRLSDENNRQDNELNMLQHKIGYKNETILVYRGIFEDRPELLELSKIENKNRSEPFEFINWSFPDKYIQFMYNVQSYECLEWVRRQPKWYSCLSSKSYELIMEHTDGPVAGAAKNEHGK